MQIKQLQLEPHEFFMIMRQRLEMTQSELAQALGMERRSVVRYEAQAAPIPEIVWNKINQLWCEVML